MAKMNWWRVEKDSKDILAGKNAGGLRDTSGHKSDCSCYDCTKVKQAKDEARRTGATYTFYTPQKRRKRERARR
jgi:hypothetical protein